MLLKHFFHFILVCITWCIAPVSECFAQSVKITNDSKEKIVVFGYEKMTVTLAYNKKATISLLTVNGQKVIEDSEGIYSLIRTKWYSPD